MTLCLIKETHTLTHGEIINVQNQFEKKIIKYTVYLGASIRNSLQIHC